MKYFCLSLIALMVSPLFAQELPNKIVFDYDISGNQIYRGIVLEFSRTTTMSRESNFSEDDKEEEDKLLEKRGYINSKLTYYPNPVKDVLYIEWDENFKKVNYIVINTANGQRLEIKSNLNHNTATTLDFINMSIGTYYLTVVYIDESEEIIKIIKK